MKLSERLENVLTLLASEDCSRVVDIGTDHGYIPIESLLRGIARGAAAADVRRGPLERAAANAAGAGVGDKISFILSDGLKDVSISDGDTLVITGMGGPLIERILTDGRGRLLKGGRLILSPQSGQPHFRQFLADNGFCITRESCAADDGKYYFIIEAVYGKEAEAYEPFELAYGRKSLFLTQSRSRRRELICRDIACFESLIRALTQDNTRARTRRNELEESLRLARTALDEYDQAAGDY